MGLFQEKICLDLPNAALEYHPTFFKEDEAHFYFNNLKEEIPWQQDQIKVFGKSYLQPRLTSLFATNGKPYTYSNITMHPHEFNGALLTIKKKLEASVGFTFTTCLLNFYRDGKDSNGWHSDDEKELGENPVIASISFGEARMFHLRHKSLKDQKHKLLLENGSMLLMHGETQHYWQHQIPKTAKKIGERINLTFRIIK